MSADTVVKLALAVIPLLIALIGPAVWFFKGLVTYLLARIAVLEGREAAVLAGMVETARAQGEEQAAQGEMLRALAKQAERERWERERGREARP